MPLDKEGVIINNLPFRLLKRICGKSLKLASAKLFGECAFTITSSS